jgi:predicted transglutaminase-like cysteine proteinase
VGKTRGLCSRYVFGAAALALFGLWAPAAAGRDSTADTLARLDLDTLPADVARAAERLEAAPDPAHDVNIFVNRRLRPIETPAWIAPAQTFATGRGSCKEYATAKAAILRRLGFRDLAIVVGIDRRAREYHAVLRVVDGYGERYLDDSEMVPQSEVSLGSYFTPTVVYPLPSAERPQRPPPP